MVWVVVLLYDAYTYMHTDKRRIWLLQNMRIYTLTYTSHKIHTYNYNFTTNPCKFIRLWAPSVISNWPSVKITRLTIYRFPQNSKNKNTLHSSVELLVEHYPGVQMVTRLQQHAWLSCPLRMMVCCGLSNCILWSYDVLYLSCVLCVMCCVLCVVCCVLLVCCVLCIVCYMLCVTCCVLCVTRCVLCVMCWVLCDVMCYVFVLCLHCVMRLWVL